MRVQPHGGIVQYDNPGVMGEVATIRSEPDGLTFREPANARVARDLKAIERVAGQLWIPRRIKRREEPAQFDGGHPAVHGLVFGQVAVHASRTLKRSTA